jgi:methylmalonyl-CoA/ethylmalonyl-CoA epimerase
MFDNMQLHHIGVITGKLEDSTTFYESLGYSSSGIYLDSIQKARIVLMQRRHDPIIELISPNSTDSPAASWIQRIQAGPYHICFEVVDLDAAITFLRGQRLSPILGPVPAIAFNMRRVVFLWSNKSGLMELLEKD